MGRTGHIERDWPACTAAPAALESKSDVILRAGNAL